MLACTIHLLLQVLVYQQGKEAGEEVGLDSVIPSYVDRPGIEVGLHDAEAVFNDPAAAIQSDDGRCGVLKVSAQGIEAVEAGLLVYHLLIERVAFYLGEFAVPFCFSLGLESSTDRAVFMDEPVSPST